MHRDGLDFELAKRNESISEIVRIQIYREMSISSFHRMIKEKKYYASCRTTVYRDHGKSIARIREQ